MTSLTLKIEGPPGRVPASALAVILTETLGILEDLRHSMARKEGVTWYITGLKMGSAEAILSTEDVSFAPQLGHEYVNGLRLVQSGESLPPYFSDASLKRLKRMTKPLGTHGAQYLDVSVGQNGSIESARTTNQTIENIDKLHHPRSRALGSITGTLDTISLRSVSKFQIFDQVSHRPVTCQFSKDHIDSVKEALGQRVTVHGNIIRNANGQPIRVGDAEFEVVPDAPRLVNLVGIDPTFTGGLSLDDYIDSIRS